MQNEVICLRSLSSTNKIEEKEKKNEKYFQ